MPHSDEALGLSLKGRQIAILTCRGTSSQSIGTTPVQVVLDANSTGPSGSITRSGSDIIVYRNGYYTFTFQPQVKENVASNTTTFWFTENGVAIPNSGFIWSSTGTNDQSVPSATITRLLNIGDTIRLFAVASSAAGATLQATASAGSVPAVSAVILDVIGFST